MVKSLRSKSKTAKTKKGYFKKGELAKVLDKGKLGKIQSKKDYFESGDKAFFSEDNTKTPVRVEIINKSGVLGKLWVKMPDGYSKQVHEGDLMKITEKKPIGVYSMGLLGGVNVYKIDYDIDDSVQYNIENADGSDIGKMKTSKIQYDKKGDAYFMADKMKVYLNEVLRTNSPWYK